MKSMSELHNNWLGGERLPGVAFLMNDSVEVVSGKHVGDSGSVVSVVKFAPFPSYIIETDSGKDIEVTESEIQIAN